MKAIKLKIYQNFVNYKVPNSIQLKETYLLPPFSTVIGMIHYLCKLKSLLRINVSVQGTNGGKVTDLYNRYEFSGAKFDESRHTHNIDGNGVTKGIASQELLTDINLVIHITHEDDSIIESLFHKLKGASDFMTLGRNEDICRVDSLSLVDITPINDRNPIELKYNAYIPSNNIIDTKFTIASQYNINTYYSYKKLPNGDIVRHFDRVNSTLLQKGSKITVKQYAKDSDGDDAFFFNLL